MALKECIRNRSLSAMNPTKNYHIPYRNSKLTLILKDAFELKSSKHCKTLIFANVSPSVADTLMTKNTISFVAPIKIGAKEKIKAPNLEPNEKNPATWTHEGLVAFINKYSKGKVNPDLFCPFESGRQIMSIPQQDFI